jgi:protein farnesyltransferase/geranylgeranyltransferase type-1 subunit alpha
MPPRNKGATKAKASECRSHRRSILPRPLQKGLHFASRILTARSAAAAAAATSSTKEQPTAPQTKNEEAWARYWATNPHETKFQELGLHGMTPADRQAYINSDYIKPGAADRLSKKAQKELWRQANDANLPLRKLPKPVPFQYGRDRHGRDVGDYPLAEYERYKAKRDRLADLQSESLEFRVARGRKDDQLVDTDTGQPIPNDSFSDQKLLDDEKARRKEMSQIKSELYGEKMGPYAMDPEWDDITPIPQVEPEGALAAIAYPEDYAECTW